jgi:hypothetical protein
LDIRPTAMPTKQTEEAVTRELIIGEIAISL